MSPGSPAASAVASPEPPSRPLRAVRWLAFWLPLALIVYLPLEPHLLSGLDGTAYWVLRLFPDLLIGLLATAVAITFGLRSSWSRALWLVAAVAATIVAIQFARGIAVADSVNGLRVLLRYLVLGLSIAAMRGDLRDLESAVLRAIGLSVGIQLVVASMEVVALLPQIPSAGITGLLGVDGTLGRYDRFGLFVASLACIGLALLRDTTLRSGIAVLVAGIVAIAFSSSRQAMVGVGVAATVLALAPGVPRLGRIGAFGAAVVLALVVATIPSQMLRVDGGDLSPPTSGPGEPPRVSTARAALTLGLDPNTNFRLYLGLVLAPWAVSQEPLFGFGPGLHIAETTDPRLEAFVERSGTTWVWARHFTNDSNYASLLIQFGLPSTIAFLVVVIWAMAAAARRWRTPEPTMARFVVLYGIVLLIAAAFGPAFEIRPSSAVFWIAAFTVASTTRPDHSGEGS